MKSRKDTGQNKLHVKLLKIPDNPLAQALFKHSDGGKQRMEIIEQYENGILTIDNALKLMHQVKVNMESPPPRIDYEEDEMDDEYDDSDSEADELPTHETEAIEDDVMEISTRKIKTDHKLRINNQHGDDNEERIIIICFS